MPQVHRFRDSVAISAPGTVYMSARDARRLAKGLMAAARSIDREAFADSPSLTVATPNYVEPLGRLERGADGRTSAAALRAQHRAARGGEPE